MIDAHLAKLRREFETMGLIEAEMAPDPSAQFELWFDAAVDAGLYEPTAFVLATSTPDGRPSARAVLMKDFGPEGVVFYTNLGSRKSQELGANPRAAATFVWTPLHRQVRFEGSVVPVEPEVADRYFSTRPRGAQIAAHASRQSRVVATRDELGSRFVEIDAEYPHQVPRPESWGGWRLVPDSVEFWQGQPNRFHDRVRYYRKEGVWALERLSP